MIETHKNTPQNEKSPIQTLTEVLHHQVENLDYDGTLKPESLEKLAAQVQTLHYIHTLMIAEATPRIEGRNHDERKLSLALRAQNQFCRSLMLLDHLSEKGKVQNELQNDI